MELIKIKKLIFISRHLPNNGQVALAKAMGYDEIEQKNLVFSSDPIKDLEENKINEKTLAIVAPSHITNVLLNEGYTLIEFVNSPVKREKMVFCCKGAYVFKLPECTEELDKAIKNVFYLDPHVVGGFQKLPHRIFGKIEQEFIPCPISIEEQVESSLVPPNK